MFFDRREPDRTRREVRADEPYPSKPIRLILPQPAGGAVDLIARSLGGSPQANPMRQPVIVENMPGANGGLAAAQVTRDDARRLHAVHGGRHQCRGQPEPLSQPHLRPVPRLHPDQHHRQGLSRAGREPEDPGEHRAGADRLRQGASRQAQLRLDRPRHAVASRHGTVEDDDQDRHHPGRPTVGPRRR